jgi:hypothetical protein
LSKSTKSRSKTQLSRAAIKAYEARRAEEVNRADADALDSPAGPSIVSPVRRNYAVSRAQEVATIRSDLRRLLMILAVLTVILIAATFVLR